MLDERKNAWLDRRIREIMSTGVTASEIIEAAGQLRSELNRKKHEYTYFKDYFNSKYGRVTPDPIRERPPEEMYCFRCDEFVDLIDGKCYRWRQGCRGCAFSGYSDTDSIR